MINWKVRIKNLNFWIALIPAILLLVTNVSELFGFELELTAIENSLLDIVKTVFVILALVGVVQDPTTAGLGDSARALTYDEPHKD